MSPGSNKFVVGRFCLRGWYQAWLWQTGEWPGVLKRRHRCGSCVGLWWLEKRAHQYKLFVCAEKFTHPQNVVMGIVSTESNCSVSARARGITIIAVTAVIRAIILGVTVNCLLMLLISKSALTASRPMSSRAQCWVIQSRKQNLIKARNFNQDHFLVNVNYNFQGLLTNQSWIFWPQTSLKKCLSLRPGCLFDRVLRCPPGRVPGDQAWPVCLPCLHPSGGDAVKLWRGREVLATGQPSSNWALGVSHKSDGRVGGAQCSSIEMVCVYAE